MESSFSFSRLLILESLPAREPQTGAHLGSYVEGLGSDFPVQVQQWESSAHLVSLLHDEIESVRTTGLIPIVHLECHGTFDARGLVAKNGDVLLWETLAPLLVELNVATGFNLVVFVAACNGGYFLEAMYVLGPAPCYGLIAPTDEVNPADVMGGARDFYRLLLQTHDVARAVDALVKHRPNVGTWFAKLAEEWFRTVVLNYVRENCNEKTLRARAKCLYRRSRKEGNAKSTGSFLRQLKQSAKVDLTGQYFDEFFQVGRISGNAQRFSTIRDVLRREVLALLR